MRKEMSSAYIPSSPTEKKFRVPSPSGWVLRNAFASVSPFGTFFHSSWNFRIWREGSTCFCAPPWCASWRRERNKKLRTMKKEEARSCYKPASDQIKFFVYCDLWTFVYFLPPGRGGIYYCSLILTDKLAFPFLIHYDTELVYVYLYIDIIIPIPKYFRASSFGAGEKVWAISGQVRLQR